MEAVEEEEEEDDVVPPVSRLPSTEAPVLATDEEPPRPPQELSERVAAPRSVEQIATERKNFFIIVFYFNPYVVGTMLGKDGRSRRTKALVKGGAPKLSVQVVGRKAREKVSLIFPSAKMINSFQ